MTDSRAGLEHALPCKDGNFLLAISKWTEVPSMIYTRGRTITGLGSSYLTRPAGVVMAGPAQEIAVGFNRVRRSCLCSQGLRGR